MKKEDFFVFIYNPHDETLWQISHKQIFDDIKEKADKDKNQTIKLLQAFERVYNGEEPESTYEIYDVEPITGKARRCC
jgi:hypothetical protein